MNMSPSCYSRDRRSYKDQVDIGTVAMDTDMVTVKFRPGFRNAVFAINCVNFVMEIVSMNNLWA